jgi:hypothetical protein
MVGVDTFEALGDYIENVIKDYSFGLINLINSASQTDKVEVNTLSFISSKEFDINKVNTRVLVECGIPIMDYMIYQNLSKENKAKVIWRVDENRRRYTETEISFSLLFIYFMLMTRNKVFIEKDENVPNFLKRFMKVSMVVEEIKECLSSNNLTLFKHEWIRYIPVKNLNSALKNRFKQGIAGMRLFSAIANNNPDKAINSNLENLVGRIKELVSKGPYWSMHTMFQSESLSSLSISANLNNLLIDLYTEEKLVSMIKSKMIFKYPKRDDRATSYLMWSDSFFEAFKDPIFKE